MKKGIVAIIILCLILPIANAAGRVQSHTASELAPGSFERDSYSFPKSIFIVENLGIGTPTPSYKLEIAGGLRLNGNLLDATGAVIFDNTTKKITAAVMPYEKGDITSDAATSSWGDANYNVNALTPQNVRQGTLYGRGQTGTLVPSSCATGTASAGTVKLSETTDLNCDSALETGSLTPASGATLTATAADVCGGKAFFGAGATWTPASGTRTACTTCNTGGTATEGDLRLNKHADLDCDGVLETGTYQSGGTLPSGWNEVCMWQEGNGPCPTTTFATRHQREVCTTYQTTNGGAELWSFHQYNGWSLKSTCSGQGCQTANISNDCGVYDNGWRAYNIPNLGSCLVHTNFTYCCQSSYPAVVDKTGMPRGSFIVYSGAPGGDNTCASAPNSRKCSLYSVCSNNLFTDYGQYNIKYYYITTEADGDFKCWWSQSGSNPVSASYQQCLVCP